jgi:CheY-like chemotaxis protein
VRMLAITQPTAATSSRLIALPAVKTPEMPITQTRSNTAATIHSTYNMGHRVSSDVPYGHLPIGLSLAVHPHTMRVLIVDDYPGLIELYDLALRARGFEVTGAATAGDALTRAATQPFDAVVLDVELPDGSGPELVDRMREIPQLERATFVGMSCYQDAELEKRFDAFLAKPFHPKRLAALLRRLVAARSPKSAAVA